MAGALAIQCREGGGLTALPQIAPDLCGRQELRSRFGCLGSPRSTIESRSLQRALFRPGQPVIVVSRKMLARGFGNLIFNSHDTQLHKIQTTQCLQYLAAETM